MKDRKEPVQQRIGEQLIKKNIEEVKSIITKDFGKLFLIWFESQTEPMQVEIVQEMMDETTRDTAKAFMDLLGELFEETEQ